MHTRLFAITINSLSFYGNFERSRDAEELGAAAVVFAISEVNPYEMPKVWKLWFTLLN